MATMNKTQLWASIEDKVSNLLENSKVSKKFQEDLWGILEDYLKPRSGGGNEAHPPKLNDKGEIVEAWCRFHQRYEDVDNMVMSKGKSKGYCKASISKWNKANAKIKKLNDEAVEAMSKGNFDKAQELAKEAESLKEIFNTPRYYDFEADWESFNKN